MKVYDGREESADAPDPEPEPERVKVGIAEYGVSTNGADLTTSGLGSCLGVALVDDVAGVGGLIHVMLPEADGGNGDNEAKFADTGVRALVEAMEEAGGDVENMRAKIAGGSNMLDFSESGSGIGERNAAAVRETLAALDVPVVEADVGGEHGRSLRLESATGDLVVKSANRGTEVL